MNLSSVKKNLQTAALFHSETSLLGHPTVVGYDKQFRWSWMATQLNTFIVVTDVGQHEINKTLIEEHLSASFQMAKDNYTGWPKGLQSGLGVISLLIGNHSTNEAEEYCLRLQSGKKWAGFTVPVIYNTTNQALYLFDKNPMWGRIYYPHFRELIHGLR